MRSETKKQQLFPNNTLPLSKIHFLTNHYFIFCYYILFILTQKAQ
jgi:hypothetical protein